ncbi:E3 ubiquitin-protein ligase listerin isoform X2 [Bicyclus anynana]|uniref:E3 ubiquitin-protein ligase listerin n=1 Tax=Bicyclus anynana TaxID=110368 RepID=A0ABM3LNA0_BICAN|nr:E3 ubiquitin-protein ligase listerin isoform X2 [Bicyclus anynana]
MGGKTKQSQRTKNNVRPSSSGRSAELIQNATNVEQYFGLGSGKAPVLFPSLAAINVDQGLTPEFSVCFKKFTKKDPVTKTKALQELTELVKTGNVEDVEAALPSWTHHYQFLSIDSDRRVREATQTCHGAVVGACGRRVAPQLRRLLPAWLLAAHDEHAPAASAARAHLQSTFPEGKLAEALTFCKAEIVAVLNDNLTGNAEHTRGKRIEEEDDKQQQLSRMLVGTLHALALLLARLPAAHGPWLWDGCVHPLLLHNHFWGLARSQQHMRVRSAWYEAMARIIERFSSRIPLPVGQKAAKALVAEPERTAAVAAQRWAALLVLMKNVEEWHTWLEKKDLLITRLLDLIENGAWGEARLLSGLLLPLLASLPLDLLTRQFYTKLFDAMFTGLDNKNLLKSKSERQTWLCNMCECLRHLTTQNHDYVVEMTTYVHRTWLEKVLNVEDTQTRHNMVRHSMTLMASLVKYWLSKSKLENSDKCDQLTRNFWQNICSTILTQIDKLTVEKDDIMQSIETHVLLFKTLNTSFSQDTKKKLSIQFEDLKTEKNEELSTIDANEETTTDESDEQLKERFRHNLNDSVERTCCSYFDFARNKEVSQSVFPLLTNLLVEFDSRKLFAALAKHFGAEPVYGLYDAVLRPWLAGDTMRCKALVDVIFLVVKYFNEEEQDSMFNSFQQFPPSVVEWCIQVTLSPPHRRSPAGRRWLRGPVVAATVLALCRREEDERAAGLLLRCLAHDDAGELLVSEAAVEGVASAVCARLEAAQAADALGSRLAELAARAAGALGSRLAELAARAAGALGGSASDSAHAHAALMLHAVFRFRLRMARLDAADAAEAARACGQWRAALPALPAPRRAELATQALLDLQRHVFCDLEELDVRRIEAAASLCPHIFGAPALTADSGAVGPLSRQLLALVDAVQPDTPVELFALRSDCIHGNIVLTFQRKNEFCKIISSTCEKTHQELSKHDLNVYVYKTLFRAYFLRKMTQNVSDGSHAHDARCDVLLNDSHFKEQFCTLLYEYAVIRTLFDYYAFWPHYETIVQTKQQLDALLNDILNDITIETKDAIYSCLTTSLTKEGFYWPFARKLFDIKFDEVTSKVKDELSKEPETSNASPENSEMEPNNELDYTLDDEDDACENLENTPVESTSAEKHTEPTFEQHLEAKLKSFKSDSKSNKKSAKGNKSVLDVSDTVFDGTTKYADEVQWEQVIGLPTFQEVITNNAYYLNLQAEARYSSDESLRFLARSRVTLRSMLVVLLRNGDALLRELARQGWEPSRPRAFISYYVNHTDRKSFMLCGRSLVGAPWEHAMSTAALLDYLGELVAREGPALDSMYWDFVNIVLSSLMDSLAQTASRWECTNVATLLRAATGLLARVEACLRALRGRPACAELLQEWDDIFYPEINKHLLKLLLLVLPEALNKWAAADDERRPRPALCCALLGNALDELQQLADAALADVTLGESVCELVPFSDSHSATLGYMLLAAAALGQSSLARGDLRQVVAERFRERKYADGLVWCALRLLPADVAAYAFKGGAPLGAERLQCFHRLPALDVLERVHGGVVGALACYVLTETLRGPGAAGARGWCGVAPALAESGLRRLVAAAVTPELVRAQLRQLQDHAHKLQDARITVLRNRAEVRCVLATDGAELELSLALAADHPLTPPAVSTPPKTPPFVNNSLNIFLASQNGSVLAALEMWTKVVKSRLQSSPRCYVCYSRLHVGNWSLPKTKCQQCRNKFHSTCLRKWFQTSRSHKCPMCRADFG